MNVYFHLCPNPPHFKYPFAMSTGATTVFSLVAKTASMRKCDAMEKSIANLEQMKPTAQLQEKMFILKVSRLKIKPVSTVGSK